MLYYSTPSCMATQPKDKPGGTWKFPRSLFALDGFRGSPREPQPPPPHPGTPAHTTRLAATASQVSAHIAKPGWDRLSVIPWNRSQ